MKLYGHEESGHAYKIALTLTLAQIPYEYERVDIGLPCAERSTQFKINSRWCEVPLLMIEDKPYIQSGAILIKLARDFDALSSRPVLETASEWILWEANRIGMCLPQLVQAKKTPEYFNNGAIEWLSSRLEIDRARLDFALQSSSFLTGQRPSVADIAVFGYIAFAQEFDIGFTKAIDAWTTRIRDLPYFQSAQSLLASS